MEMASCFDRVGLSVLLILSLFITSTGFSSSELARRGINAPTSQSLANYVLLAIVYGGILFCRRNGMKAKWYYYLLLGLVDVEANYLGKSSTITSDHLPYTCYNRAVATLLKGICWSLLVIAGATLYAVCNVSEEFFTKTADQVELLAMLGLFGGIVSGIQIAFEREELKSIHWLSGAVIPYAGFAAAMFLFYSGVPVLLKISGSTMLNLSLLTSDMWSVLIRIFVYREKVDWIYFVAFAAVAVGLVVYSLFDKEKVVTVMMNWKKNKHFDEEADVAGSVKLNTLARSSNVHQPCSN
ncbi:hypothetical protein L1987_04577 [Smallanthus sonchifolius]|uniref:Uncharacterized protein n=1 Tax=Smallanthus sonchifolius TaxID=185202 RepID=A0ACB9JT44_9ASTR|nr:hypothetical protein L1987_04577 [Smallanthus sonchifolius]